MTNKRGEGGVQRLEGDTITTYSCKILPLRDGLALWLREVAPALLLTGYVKYALQNSTCHTTYMYMEMVGSNTSLILYWNLY